MESAQRGSRLKGNDLMADNHTHEQRSANMRAVRGKDTAPEVLIRSLLHRRGYRFRLHRKDLPGTPDIVFPAKQAVIFVHGCFWHGHDCSRGHLPETNRSFWQQKITKNIERDSRAKMQLEAGGWKVLTVWQCQTKDKDNLVRSLSRLLERKRTVAATNKEVT